MIFSLHEQKPLTVMILFIKFSRNFLNSTPILHPNSEFHDFANAAKQGKFADIQFIRKSSNESTREEKTLPCKFTRNKFEIETHRFVSEYI